jgi:clan AA aspartic protease (TIGR02281 family)
MKTALSLFLLVVVSFWLGWFAKGQKNSKQDIYPVEITIESGRANSHSERAVTARETTLAVDDSNTQSVLERFRFLLGVHAFDEAVQLFEEVKASNEIQGRALHAHLMVYLEAAIKQERNDSFMALVDSYLSRYYDDIDVLILLVKFQALQGYPDEAARVLQMASVYAYQPNERKRVSAVLRALVENTDKSLSQEQRWSELLSFYQLLDSIDLSQPGYQLRQAVVYIELGENFMAKNLLLPLEDDIQLGEKARELLAIIAKQSGDSAEQTAAIESIPLIRRGNHYLIKATLNNVSEVTLMIDTGASITSLSQRSFSALVNESNYSSLGSRLFNTANGVTKGEVYRADKLSLGNNILEGVNLSVLDFQQRSGVDGLLGMNVLQNFRFEIDQDKEVLYLQER